jgi:hypothetical protein
MKVNRQSVMYTENQGPAFEKAAVPKPCASAHSQYFWDRLKKLRVIEQVQCVSRDEMPRGILSLACFGEE